MNQYPLAHSMGQGMFFCNSGNPPSARYAHSLTYDALTGQVVLVGGVSTNGQTFLSDTWHYQTGWTRVNPVVALPPTAYHQAVYADGRILLVTKGQVWVYE